MATGPAAMASVMLIILCLFSAAIFFDTRGQMCPLGEFPCDNGTKCILQKFQCDGESNCADGKDENECVDLYGATITLSNSSRSKNATNKDYKRCDVTNFPKGCICTNRTELFCKSLEITEIPHTIVGNPSRLILSNNSISELHSKDFRNYGHLIFLSLAGNEIDRIENGTFSGLQALRLLYLPKNYLKSLPKEAFLGLTTLQNLNLADNFLEDLSLDAFLNTPNILILNMARNRLSLLGEEFPHLQKLTDLDLSGNRIEHIMEYTFRSLTSLTVIFLENNRIKRIDAKSFFSQSVLVELNLTYNRLELIFEETFSRLKALNTLNLSFNEMLKIPTNVFSQMSSLQSLGLLGIDIDNISPKMFDQNRKLEFIYFKRFHYCSAAPRVRICRPNTDGVSSMEDLLVNPLLRMSVWVVATLTCVGNVVVIMGRHAAKGEHKSLSIFIKNLSAADFLMGVYLFAIAAHDRAYRGNYNNYANSWMTSWQCTLVGVLAMTSSETSLLILCLMSVEHCLVIVSQPSSNFQLSTRAVLAGTVGVWSVGTMLALVPALYWTTANGFYGGNGVCFPLHIDDPFVLGWQYSAFVFLGLNFVSVVIICIVYVWMFTSYRRSSRRAPSYPPVNVRKIAFRVFAIVFTDCLCWIPIICLKMIAIANFPIAADLNAWVVVFILPINSAINPFIYTFSTSKFRGGVNKMLATFVRRLSLTLIRKESAEDTTVETDPSCGSCKENGRIKSLPQSDCQCPPDDVTIILPPNFTNPFVTDVDISGFGWCQAKSDVVPDSNV